MKYRTSLISLALFALTFAGCSKHLQTADVLKVTDLGIIEITDGKSSSRILADGRTCVLMPTVLRGGHEIQLEMSISETNAAGTRHVYSLTSYFNPDQATTFTFNSTNVMRLTLHIS